MHRPLILVGGGGHCKSVIEAAESAGFEIKGILDMPDLQGTKTLGYEVIGTDDDIPIFVDKYDFIITLGFIQNPQRRLQLHERIGDIGGQLATIIASTAYVSSHAKLGVGTVVLHHANVNAGAEIGESVIINSCANIEHDVIVGDFCHVSTKTSLNGSCAIGEKSFIGSGTVVANNVSVGSNVTVGIGSVVLRDIPSDTFCFGNPAHHNIYSK